LGTITNKTTIIIVMKHARTQFDATWTLTTIKEVDDKFTKTFK
jgi:hypothetical protein